MNILTREVSQELTLQEVLLARQSLTQVWLPLEICAVQLTSDVHTTRQGFPESSRDRDPRGRLRPRGRVDAVLLQRQPAISHHVAFAIRKATSSIRSTVPAAHRSFSNPKLGHFLSILSRINRSFLYRLAECRVSVIHLTENAV